MPTDLPNSESRRYCEDCRFFRAVPNGLTYARCDHDKAVSPNNAGDKFICRELDKPADRLYCSTARTSATLCGESAAWFEPRLAVTEAA